MQNRMDDARGFDVEFCVKFMSCQKPIYILVFSFYSRILLQNIYGLERAARMAVHPLWSITL